MNNFHVGLHRSGGFSLTGTLDILALVQILIELGRLHFRLTFDKFKKFRFWIEALQIITESFTHFH